MNLKIDTTEHDAYYEINVAGELDVATVPELQEVLIPIRQQGTHDIHLRIDEVTYMDSTGLGLFVGTLKELNKNNKELYVLGVNKRIERLFDITGLKDLMHVNQPVEG
ncbi:MULTISPECIES: anti-sigma factor antagonist [Staphylococcaceae]|uniref:Anti-sigma factor antagonist n=1 Tax=Macrococcus psychrotolerans TaxID=3039389 RepID=A0AAU6RED9_9STAP|nr:MULTISPECIES: anti-sigma factor antagonist [Macrococcus]MDJ1109468.1 anti-sigma factor antagonist [Macrococcus caseolyticus]MDJ1112769.1 anti-sigma factor antagonist [Macrococcus sp. S115]PKE10027.1 anti-anti-sigma factor [Macrococcus caseolyticus]PKE33444.1 anti-anti-sigma factor [Macrococcus caseolyticus]PKE46658.1 anti-anti-sigma factor [Macrococcus caseolyticus]